MKRPLKLQLQRPILSKGKNKAVSTYYQETA